MTMIRVLALAVVVPLLSAWPQTEQDGSATLTAGTALQHVGEDATVCGTIDEVAYRPSMAGAPTFLIFRSIRDEATFVLVISGDDRVNFVGPPESIYEEGQVVCATGTIGEIVPGQTAGILVDRPDRIEVTDFTAPIKIHHVAPEYPMIARRAQIEGDVLVAALIDIQGAVTSPTIVSPLPHESVNLAALRAVRQWRFTPATRDGEPVPVHLTVVVAFRLVRDYP